MSERSKAINGVTAAQMLGGGAKAPSPTPTPEAAPSASQEAAQALYRRSDGREVLMGDMNPHHRARAADKAQREGNADLAAKLRASGPLE